MLTRIYSREKELEIIGPKYERLLARVYAGQASPRDAVKAACLICRETVRGEIKRCRETGCALWAYRPYQEK
jgi:hypothetical protein